jgi:hypothetical protein
MSLSDKSLEELSKMAKRMGVRRTRSDGTRKDKSQLCRSIQKAKGHKGAGESRARSKSRTRSKSRSRSKSRGHKKSKTSKKSHH